MDADLKGQQSTPLCQSTWSLLAGSAGVVSRIPEGGFEVPLSGATRCGSGSGSLDPLRTLDAQPLMPNAA